MHQRKPTNKMADFLSILTCSHQELICVITYQKFHWEVSCSWSLKWRHRSSGFYCNRFEIKHFKKCLKMPSIFHTRSLYYKHPVLSVAYSIYQGKRAVSWPHETQDVLRTKPIWKMANFLRKNSQATYYDISVTTYQKIEGKGKIS